QAADERPPPGTDLEGNGFPVVGVGASAGGLEAIGELLEHFPPDPGLAILVVLHLDPHQKSHLPEIIGKMTRMPVRQASAGMKVEKDQIYLVPPDANMALTDGHLLLTPRPPASRNNMPIDHLFRSLAGVKKAQAIGVILSGGGSDGTLGFQAIKAEGRVTFAQDENSARQ